jgi:small-conductance mechanosensitive channel
MVPHAAPGPCAGHASRACRQLACALGFALALCGASHAQQPATADQKAKPATAEAPPSAAPVALADIAAHAESAAADLREIEESLAEDETVEAIAQALPPFLRENEARLREHARILAQRPSLDLLRALERSLQRERSQLGRWSRDINSRAENLERDLARIAAMDKAWTGTLELATGDEAAPELVQRVRALLSVAGRVRAALEKERARTLRLQSRVTAQEVRLAEAIAGTRAARETALTRIFRRDSPPIWSPKVPQARDETGLERQRSLSVQRSAFDDYVSRQSGAFLAHGGLFLLLCAGLYWARRKTVAWAGEDADLQRVAAVFAWPVATALVLALMASRWFYPDGPRVLWVIIGAAALVPTALVLRLLLDRALRPLLYLIVTLFFVDQVRAVTASMTYIPRALFIAELLGAALVLLWFLRSGRLASYRPAPDESPSARTVRAGTEIACVVLAASAAANAVGYVTLGNLVGTAALRGAYLGIILFTIIAILDGLVTIALRLRPLTLLGMVRSHAALLRRRVRRVFVWIALALWSLYLLDRLAVRDTLLGGAKEVLTTELNLGAVAISPADVIAFIVTIWASFVVSRFLRFVLDEEIYPHARLQRGLPYAISNTVHYAVLVAGFLLAVAALGFDMTKFTILAGAFTVGVGFGLQAIFNNFVSGIILLFERPVQVGDMIQMDDATTGIVERIGIRASVVRTSAGSEAIVPNGKLISERIINWTFSDRRRGLELPFAVAHGTDPRRVIAIMERVAGEHPLVRKDPSPEALLVRPGPDWMGFELRATTDRVEDWMKVRSELAVAISEALAAEKIPMK